MFMSVPVADSNKQCKGIKIIKCCLCAVCKLPIVNYYLKPWLYSISQNMSKTKIPPYLMNIHMTHGIRSSPKYAKSTTKHESLH